MILHVCWTSELSVTECYIAVLCCFVFILVLKDILFLVSFHFLCLVTVCYVPCLLQQLLLYLFFSIVNIKSLVTLCILTSDGRNDESIEPILHKWFTESNHSKHDALVTPAGQKCANTTKTQTMQKKKQLLKTIANVLLKV